MIWLWNFPYWWNVWNHTPQKQAVIGQNVSFLILKSINVYVLSCCRLCEKDPFQLYQRLEQQAREYVLEMKVRLLKHLSAGPKTPAPMGTVATLLGPPQAYQFISLLLEEYSALSQAARTISSFLLTLVSLTSPRSPACGLHRSSQPVFLILISQENEHLKKFQVTWELHNKHLFENLVFSEPILHSSLPTLVAQLK